MAAARGSASSTNTRRTNACSSSCCRRGRSRRKAALCRAPWRGAGSTRPAPWRYPRTRARPSVRRRRPPALGAGSSRVSAWETRTSAPSPCCSASSSETRRCSSTCALSQRRAPLRSLRPRCTESLPPRRAAGQSCLATCSTLRSARPCSPSSLAARCLSSARTEGPPSRPCSSCPPPTARRGCWCVTGMIRRWGEGGSLCEARRRSPSPERWRGARRSSHARTPGRA
mmetsp:Transcript_51738/g.172667  ORF Transcript_51738/g.172667 Transcript_51738/m.172667 type:complete len:228 (+) Transcript_51738:417-1100(+)